MKNRNSARSKFLAVFINEYDLMKCLELDALAYYTILQVTHYSQQQK